MGWCMTTRRNSINWIKWPGCHAGHQEFSRCHTRSESKEFIVHSWQSMQVTDPSWLWSPEQRSPEVQNGDISGPTKGLMPFKNFLFEKKHKIYSDSIRRYMMHNRPISVLVSLGTHGQRKINLIITKVGSHTLQNKNAVQWDAYHPLHCPSVLGGVCLWVQGVSASGSRRVVCLWVGGVYHTPFHHNPLHHTHLREQNDWQTGVKTLLCSKLRLRVVNIITESMFLFNIL